MLTCQHEVLGAFSLVTFPHQPASSSSPCVYHLMGLEFGPCHYIQSLTLFLVYSYCLLVIGIPASVPCSFRQSFSESLIHIAADIFLK